MLLATMYCVPHGWNIDMNGFAFTLQLLLVLGQLRAKGLSRICCQQHDVYFFVITKSSHSMYNAC